MRSWLVNGEFVPPKNLAMGKERLQQLDHQIPKMQAKGVDGNAGWLVKERRLLAAWIEAQEKPVDYDEFWRELA